MKITEELVDYVSELSRLKLPEAEKAAMAAELEKIVDYMDVLSGLDTTGVEPLSHVFPVKNVLRADQVAPSCDREALLAGAPASDGEAFLVPRAVE
ncbi:Asp-tRNA(Asn)/Glu-tRNA(Gln) amidotransferase subunit GatC [uncultured Flavonifractor sp.]|uniref:Asp-tRNA(Asn)/Glu-tRNA(Gln) amidotransferase subunit GatC n=1 Tax=uncultured Flavonifractor sp. TaxID=1193534 RepID=UPI0025FDDB0C|nr:Asp-tRNA(Asn)/Glu-tRNA(Gln) amidotransferase subunit GatC [uncultured Flavonifractor sp.]